MTRSIYPQVIKSIVVLIIILGASYLTFTKLTQKDSTLLPSDLDMFKGELIRNEIDNPGKLCPNRFYLLTGNNLIWLVLDGEGTENTSQYFLPYINSQIAVAGRKQDNPTICKSENIGCVCNSDFILLVDDIKSTNVLLQISAKVKQLFRSRL